MKRTEADGDLLASSVFWFCWDSIGQSQPVGLRISVLKPGDWIGQLHLELPVRFEMGSSHIWMCGRYRK